MGVSALCRYELKLGFFQLNSNMNSLEAVPEKMFVKEATLRCHERSLAKSCGWKSHPEMRRGIGRSQKDKYFYFSEFS